MGSALVLAQRRGRGPAGTLDWPDGPVPRRPLRPVMLEALPLDDERDLEAQ